jgi:hypothetical protein
VLKMPEREKSKAYITYDFNDISREHLLTSRKVNTKTLIIGSKRKELSKSMNKYMLYHMENVAGVTVKTNEYWAECGKPNLFGIKGTRSKIITLNGKKFVEVRIVADNPNLLYGSIFAFRSKMADFDIKEKMCTWDKVGDLSLHPDEIDTSKIIPEFDVIEVANRRALELQTSRQN